MRKRYPVVLSIAGSDCSGGAGIQADLKTISALGAYAATAITAITVQNTQGVRTVESVPAAIVGAQVAAVMDDLRPDAIKIGMLTDADVVRTLRSTLTAYPPCPVVLDPVMVSTSGRRLLAEEAVEALVDELFPLCTLVTPNLAEAAVLTGQPVGDTATMKQAARRLLGLGCKAVLLKGGHLAGQTATDVLDTGTEVHLLDAAHIESRNTHGTGCTLSSAIATFIALGKPLPEAVAEAKYFVHTAIEAGRDVQAGEGNGPLNHLFAPQRMHILEEKV